MFCRNQTTRATVARGSALEMEIRRGKFRRSVFLDTAQGLRLSSGSVSGPLGAAGELPCGISMKRLPRVKAPSLPRAKGHRVVLV
ncbi:Rhotekin [Liparis tanakae]|uniref:Rhotekin n=1 Tax=Liparis tanakae TaxID=230148 RepID=A0A4Z2G9L5_9TELE|nr:Rhotekin [Liparis tanakae]